jgi:type II secretory pathway component PulJ
METIAMVYDVTVSSLFLWVALAVICTLLILIWFAYHVMQSDEIIIESQRQQIHDLKIRVETLARSDGVGFL